MFKAFRRLVATLGFATIAVLNVAWGTTDTGATLAPYRLELATSVAPVHFAVIGDFGQAGPGEAQVAALVHS